VDFRIVLLFCLAALAGAGCGSSTSDGNDASDRPTLSISAIPDQDPELLARLYPDVADVLSRELGVPVRYRPVTDYAASVTSFKTGDLDLVWFGGLTGVQAEAQVPGAVPLAQRDIDADFHSVFVASRKSGIGRIDDVRGLVALRGKRFTFGSESSTSGRLMPEYFLDQAGVSTDDFRGEPGFSGSHDKTIALVSSGSYDAGVLNEQVWKDRLEEGEVDRSEVRVVFRTRSYHDYYWVARPDLDERLGKGFTKRLRQALLDLRDPDVLELFGATRFIPVRRGDHDETREVAERLGLLDKAGA
jgi:phosphonate transport system substrate-binding protein